MGIISGLGSFRGQVGDHFRVGDHFGVGIISGAVQITNKTSFLKKKKDIFPWTILGLIYISFLAARLSVVCKQKQFTIFRSHVYLQTEH